MKKPKKKNPSARHSAITPGAHNHHTADRGGRAEPDSGSLNLFMKFDPLYL